MQHEDTTAARRSSFIAVPLFPRLPCLCGKQRKYSLFRFLCCCLSQTQVVGAPPTPDRPKGEPSGSPQSPIPYSNPYYDPYRVRAPNDTGVSPVMCVSVYLPLQFQPWPDPQCTGPPGPPGPPGRRGDLGPAGRSVSLLLRFIH